MKKLKLNRTTYNILVFSDIVWTFAVGILGPIYAIYVEGIGGNLIGVGLAYALLLFTSAILTIPFSGLADKIGMKKVIVMGCLIYLPVPFLYPSVTNMLQVFILQIWDGISSAISEPAWEALLAEATEPKKRGKQYGIKHAAIRFSGGIAALLGGIIAQFLGFKYTFYFVGILGVIATLIVFLVEDKHDSKKRIKIKNK